MRSVDFFRSAYEDNRARPRGLRRRLTTDLLLWAFNRALAPLERLLVRRWREARRPVAFIVGTPRSGTTLLFQLLARHLEVGYPTNFMARFWMAPVVGAVVDRHLPRRRSIPLESDYGRTRGSASPHELGWFWRHHLRPGACDALTEDELGRVDAGRLRDELTALAGVSGRPFVWKNVNFTDYHVRWLYELLPDARFVWLRRDPLAVAISVLRARRRHYGDRERWWSIRPRDVEAWRGRHWAEQIAHQIGDVEDALARQTAALPPSAVARLAYEDLVDDPESALRALAELLETPIRDPSALAGVELERGGVRDPDPAERAALERAWAGRTKGGGAP